MSLNQTENEDKTWDNLKYNEIKDIDEIVDLPRNVRWIVFVIFVFLNVVMNIDHGSVPAATEKIKFDLGIDDSILGIFGSLVFLGNLIGALVSFSLINFFNRKYLLIISLFLNTSCLCTFIIKKAPVYFLFTNRILVGTFQSFISIYLPVWCDQFGIYKKKTMMISYIQVATPLGIVVGYLLTYLIMNNIGWKYSFIIQGGLIGIIILILLFIPNKYFSSSIRRESKENPEDKTSEDEVDKNNTVFTETRHRVSKNEKSSNSCKKLCLIFAEPVFIFCILSLSSLFFIITAIQYWATNYMEETIHVENQNLYFYSYVIICLTSPTLGVLIGGKIVSLFGGYESKHSILLCGLFGMLASGFAFFVPFQKEIWFFTLLLWLVLFFGGAIVAPLTGIIITSLPQELAGSANSITNFFCILFGYLPAPSVYGWIKTIKNVHFAMQVTMWYSFSGVFWMIFAILFRYKNFNKIKRDYIMSVNEQRKLTLNKRHSTNFSVNVPKIFGRYMPYDEGNEIHLIGESTPKGGDHRCYSSQNPSNEETLVLPNNSQKNTL